MPDVDLTLADFDYHLPPERIAHEPARPRDSARLLHVRADGLDDLTIRDLPSLLGPGDILVANDTRVFPAQLRASRGGARIGITLDRPRGDGAWKALARNGRRLRVGDTLAIEGAGGLAAEIVDKADDGSIGLAFNREGEALMQAFEAAGALALPPYIHRPARTDRRRRHGLPDGLCPAERCRRRAHGRPAFHAGVAGGA